LENGAEISGATGESYSNTVGKAAGTYVYVRMAYTAACGWQSANAFIVSVTGSTAPAITKPADGCAGIDYVFMVPVVSGTTYEWTGGGTPNGNSYTYSNATAGAKTVTVRARTTACSSTPATASVTVNALPANPTVTAGSRCGSGTVTLLASSSGAVIDWYEAATGGTALVSGNNTYTPSVTVTKTYYAQARNSTTNCISAARTAVTAKINAVPTITRTGGDASQTVTQNTAISAITYTASDAIGIGLSSGSFPTGVTGTPSGFVFTISGTPSVAGAFNYSVTASHTNGCSSTASSGSITVNAVDTTPPNAASTQTWSYGTLTWSDRITAAATLCTETNILTTSTNTSAEYKVSGGHYYYTWTCAYISRDAFCPAPWRIPSRLDFQSLTNYVTSQSLSTAWGLGGYLEGQSVQEQGARSAYWAETAYSSQMAYVLQYYPGYLNLNATQYKHWAMEVRCVK
jgi:hypothetical protein